MEIDPRRHLQIEGTLNIRDLGGYETEDGKGKTQWRRFLRADSLFDLPDASRQALVDLGLRTVVDLRRGSELATAPSVFAGSTDVAYHHLDMIGEGALEEAQPLRESVERMAHMYCLWLDRRQEPVGRILSVLAAADAVPALFNCAAGKDRTGVTSALLLSVAGVDDDVVAVLADLANALGHGVQCTPQMGVLVHCLAVIAPGRTPVSKATVYDGALEQPFVAA